MAFSRKSLFICTLASVSWCWGIFPGQAEAQQAQREGWVNPGYILEHWTVEDGLPVNSVNDLLQSNQGYIWLATYDGLVRFDGVRFTTYHSSGNSGLPSSRFLQVVESDDGTLLLRTEQGHLVTFKNNGMFEDLSSALNFNTHVLHPDSMGTVWIGTDKGIWTYRSGDLEPFSPEIIKAGITNIFPDREGGVWFRDENRLIKRFADGTVNTIINEPQYALAWNPFYNAKDNTVWIGASGKLYSWKQGVLNLTADLTKGQNSVNGISMDDADRLWISTSDGDYYRFSENGMEKMEGENPVNGPFFKDKEGTSWRLGQHTLYKEDELILEIPYYLGKPMEDHEGSIWIATYNNGLYRIKPNMFELISEEEGLSNRNVYPILQTTDGAVWVGTLGGGINRIKNGAITQFDEADGLDGMLTRSLFQKKDGTLLVGQVSGKVQSFKEGRFHTEFDAGGTVHSMFESAAGTLWIGSDAGLFSSAGDQWIQHTNEPGRPDRLVRFMTQAPDKSIWMATNGGGVLQYKNEKFFELTRTDGLASNLVRSIYIDTAGAGNQPDNYVLWIGTEDRGMNYIDVREGVPDITNIAHLSRNNGLYDNGIHMILEDTENRLWMSTNRGIFWAGKDELLKIVRGESTYYPSTSYNEKDGMRNREGNGGMQPAGMKAQDGTLWFPTQDGVVKVDPAQILTNTIPPQIVIEELKSGNEIIPIEHGIVELKSHQRNIEIKFTALSFLVPEKVDIITKLEGFEEQWTLRPERKTGFTNLPAGAYTFHILAANNDGIWNEEGISLDILIEPFFYETLWFKLLMGLLLIAGFTGVLRWRTAHLAGQRLKLQNLVNEQTEQLTLEKKKTEEQADKLKALDKAKSHFFANISHEFRTPLTLIIGPLKQFLGTKKYPGNDREQFQRMLRNSQRLLRLVNQILDLTKLEAGELKLNAQPVDMVAFVKGMAEMFRSTCKNRDLTLNVESHIESCVLMADTDKMEKVLGNLLSNAVKFTKPGGNISISMKEYENTFEITISDNGIGIPEESLSHIFDRFYQSDASETREAEGTGIGLALVKELVELHGGSVSVISEVGTGSSFSLSFPKSGKTILPGTSSSLAHENTSELIEISTVRESGTEKQEDQEDADRTTVLIVEDNNDMRSFISEILQKDYKLLEATHGIEALEIIEKQLPDVIVSDVMMPEMDGVSLNLELKKDPVLASIPVIFLTAKAGEELIIESLKEGADDYITKPFNADLLQARIKNLLDVRMRLRTHLRNEWKPFSSATPETAGLEQQVFEKISKHFSDPDFSVHTLAGEFYMDRTTLYRKIKETTGKTPKQLILALRLEKAAELLNLKEGTISEVAYAVGFNSLGYFCRCFKNHYRKTPGEFIEDLKG